MQPDLDQRRDVVPADRSGEIEYKELARAIKYGDPRRIESMRQQKLKLERMAQRRSRRKVKLEGAEKGSGQAQENGTKEALEAEGGIGETALDVLEADGK